MANKGTLLLAAAFAALLSASCPAVSVVVDLPSPKPGPALAARIAGGEISVCRRDLFGHHPHGTDPDKTACIVDFFNEDKTENGDK